MPRDMDILLQQIINGLTTGSVYAVVALGYTMVYGVIQLINFAHGEVVMIGAMVAFSVITSLAGSGLPPLAIVLAGVMAAIPACMASATCWSARPIVPCATRRAWRR
jgi:branched-chain amino acid transport system permease protein